MLSGSVKQRLPLSLDGNTEASAQANAVSALQNAHCTTVPFRHWLFQDAIFTDVCQEIVSMPIKAPVIEETYGKRDSHNELRNFFTPDLQEKRYAVSMVANIFQSSLVARAIEKLCDIKLQGSYLRIEYCQDHNGFWLEPHMDIKEKLMTMQIYLNTGADAATLGTDLYDADKKHHSTAPSEMGQGMIFIPSEPNSWHGFEKRPIRDLRRSLIINYVTDDWRARHELAFPEQPITF